MAKGIKHKDVGSELTYAEWNADDSHFLASGTSFPTAPSEGDLYYRTDEHKWYIYDGTSWQTINWNYTPVNKAGDTMTGSLKLEGVDESPTLIFNTSTYGLAGAIQGVSDALEVSGALDKNLRLNASGTGRIELVNHALPSATNEIDLGSDTLRWRNIYIGQSAFTNNVLLSSLTIDPTLASGILWFRSDLNRLRFSPDGVTIDEFVKRAGDTMTDNLTIKKTLNPKLILDGVEAYIDFRGRLFLSSEEVVWLDIKSDGVFSDLDLKPLYDGGCSLGDEKYRWDNAHFLGDIYIKGKVDGVKLKEWALTQDIIVR